MRIWNQTHMHAQIHTRICRQSAEMALYLFILFLRLVFQSLLFGFYFIYVLFNLGDQRVGWSGRWKFFFLYKPDSMLEHLLACERVCVLYVQVDCVFCPFLQIFELELSLILISATDSAYLFIIINLKHRIRFVIVVDF